MSINFKNVFYTYSPKTPFQYEALKGINLNIEKGSFTAIVGMTGCGKSTLVQELNALLIPTSGEVDVDNFIVCKDKKKRSKKVYELRKHVGLVFQFPEYQLFEETVEKDVSYGPINFKVNKEEALKVAHEALKEVGLDESYFKRSPFELSGGEKRRVAIAGIIAFHPEILVLDEPTAGLDPIGSQNIMELFKKINESGITIVLVTHDMDVVMKYASHVVVMEDGEIKEDTTPKKLFCDVKKDYSLELPSIYRFAKELKENGFNIDVNKVEDISSLAQEIKKGMK